MGLYSVSESDNPLINKDLGKNTLSLRRSSFQITLELLTAISKGEYRPTRLMYECNLSWNSIRKTLALLESKGLIDEVSGNMKRKHYSVTAKGRELLGYYSGLQELVQV